MKISIISGTHRDGSFTRKVSEYLCGLPQWTPGHAVSLYSLEDLPHDFTFSAFRKKNNIFEKQAEEYVLKADAFIWVIPEYNGSYPGIVKAWIDCIPPNYFNHKASGIIGVSSGRAGNLRGLDHLTGVLQHLKMHVFHARLPISRIEEVFENANPDSETENTLKSWIPEFIKFAGQIR